jgi:vancomycin resistance protein VanW
MSTSKPLPVELPVQLASYACPLINPPAQRHMFANKIHNIELAIARIEPLWLQPGQVFSFWRRVLAPTRENGYREGATFVNRRVIASFGGGLCQLSGVIYNLALLSGMQILERHNHSIDAYGEERYIPLGRDATVAYGRKDLRFGNPHRFPVAFELRVDERQASGTVCGTQPLDCAIRIETALIRTIESPRKRIADSALSANQEVVEPGLTGKVVRAWRVFERPGRPPRREGLSRDRYRETPTLVRRGGPPRATLWTTRLLARFGLHG